MASLGTVERAIYENIRGLGQSPGLQFHLRQGVLFGVGVDPTKQFLVHINILGLRQGPNRNLYLYQGDIQTFQFFVKITKYILI